MVFLGIFLVIIGVSIFGVIERRRTAKTYKDSVAARSRREVEMAKAYHDAYAESRAQIGEFVELQREANRLLALIAAKLDRTRD